MSQCVCFYRIDGTGNCGFAGSRKPIDPESLHANDPPINRMDCFDRVKRDGKDYFVCKLQKSAGVQAYVAVSTSSVV